MTADLAGRIFGVALTLALVLPPIIFLFIIFKKFDVDNDGLDDY
jgi:chromate transport protein ChrA